MRSHYCGHVNETLIDATVELCGWVHRRRDHGGVIFIDLRDREGLVQVVIDPDTAEAFANAERCRSEYVLRIKGKVRGRPEGSTNEDLASGKIEVLGQELEILNSAKTPPFPLDEETDVREEVRLRYRYIDLRRPDMLANLRLRSKVTTALREYLDAEGFMDIETPILTKATPEGARDFLVPSRVHNGQFYALPQSPQLFKQLLMVSGMDRYYQIVRCFRDEDLRADRQPEFTQLDIETSFLDEEEIMRINEDMIRSVFSKVMGIELPNPFPRMPHEEAIRRFGVDKPDMRIPLELIDVDDLMKEVDFKVFAGPANDPDSRVTALRLPKGCELSRKDIDGLTKYVSIYGARGLAYIKVNELAAGRDGLQSPIVKNLPDDVLTEIMKRTEAEDGDIVFFGADKAHIVSEALGALRVKLGHDRDMVKDEWCPLWVVDFPMFEKDHDSGRWQALHHPFTAPSVDSAEALEANPGEALSRAYDMILNGSEVGGGSVRIHKPDMQAAVFRILGISDEEAADKFGFLLDALAYGCPPHGGLAFGLDRLIMLMADVPSIREVMAFPKTQSAGCLLTDAPSSVNEVQLKELSLRIRKLVVEE